MRRLVDELHLHRRNSSAGLVGNRSSDSAAGALTHRQRRNEQHHRNHARDPTQGISFFSYGELHNLTPVPENLFLPVISRLLSPANLTIILQTYEMTDTVSRRKNSSKASAPQDPEPLLRISEVARRVGISSSALRAWESLGLVVPHRTRSKYRLYSIEDVKLLQRAIFLRRARGLNPAAIVHVLKHQGVVSVPAESVLSPGQRFRRLRQRRSLSLLQVARATGVSVGFLSSLERGQMRASVATLTRIARFYRTNLFSFFDS